MRVGLSFALVQYLSSFMLIQLSGFRNEIYSLNFSYYVLQINQVNYFIFSMRINDWIDFKKNTFFKFKSIWKWTKQASFMGKLENVRIKKYNELTFETLLLWATEGTRVRSFEYSLCRSLRRWRRTRLRANLCELEHWFCEFVTIIILERKKRKEKQLSFIPRMKKKKYYEQYNVSLFLFF